MAEEYASNQMRSEIIKKIMKDKGYTIEQMAKMTLEEFPTDDKDTAGALKVALNSKIGDEWCEKLEKVLNLPKDTLKNIK